MVTYFVSRSHGVGYNECKQHVEMGFEGKKVKWTGMLEIRKGLHTEKLQAVGAVCMAIFWPTTGFKERIWVLFRI